MPPREEAQHRSRSEEQGCPLVRVPPLHWALQHLRKTNLLSQFWQNRNASKFHQQKQEALVSLGAYCRPRPPFPSPPNVFTHHDRDETLLSHYSLLLYVRIVVDKDSKDNRLHICIGTELNVLSFL